MQEVSEPPTYFLQKLRCLQKSHVVIMTRFSKFDFLESKLVENGNPILNVYSRLSYSCESTKDPTKLQPV